MKLNSASTTRRTEIQLYVGNWVQSNFSGKSPSYECRISTSEIAISRSTAISQNAVGDVENGNNCWITNTTLQHHRFASNMAGIEYSKQDVN